jgi:sulfur carrier protein
LHGLFDRPITRSPDFGTPPNIVNVLTVTLTINGEEKTFSSDLTLAAAIAQLGMKADRVAVELNRKIIPRTEWPATRLKEGDRLEIVHFVGGGSARLLSFSEVKRQGIPAPRPRS